MTHCSRCGIQRHEGSFSTDAPGICKPCIYRPKATKVKKDRYLESKQKREQKSVLYVVKHTQANQSFVYLVKASGRFKIGFSTNVNKRVRQLETGSPETVQLIAVAPGGRLLEQEVHKTFKDAKIRGEWFDSQTAIINHFALLPGSMVFLPGYLSQDSPPDVQVD